MATFADVETIGLNFPAVAQGSFYGTPGLKVAGKGFCRIWSEREHERDGVDDTAVLVVFCDPDEKPALIGASNGVLFSTPHYDGHGALLIRLDDVTVEDLSDYLEDSYRLKAKPAHVRELDDA